VMNPGYLGRSQVRSQVIKKKPDIAYKALLQASLRKEETP